MANDSTLDTLDTLDQAIQRLKDIDAGVIDPDADPTCRSCGSDKRELRKNTYKCTQSFKPGDLMEIRYTDPLDGPQHEGDNMIASPCSASWHDAKVAV
jgi:hypothetical protein